MSENVLTFTDLKGPSEAGQYHRFLCMTGENKGTSYILIGLRVVAGRGKNIDIQINDTKASREHFELAKIKESYVLTDLKSQNGTIVNDLKVTQHRLSDHDTVIVGKTIFKYSLLTVLEKGNYLQKKETDEIQVEKLKNEKSVITKTVAKNNNKKFLLYGILILIAIASLFTSNDATQGQNKKKTGEGTLEEDEILVQNLKKSEASKEDELEQEVYVYIHRGLRELREKNFYRALHEFEQALVRAPNHNRADFYKKKTQQALDEEIDQLFAKAARDRESLRLIEAVKTYCSIMRLIDQNPNDERYVAAQKNIKVLNDELGLKEDENICN